MQNKHDSKRLAAEEHKLPYQHTIDYLLDGLGNDLIPNEGDKLIFTRGNEPLLPLRINGGEREDFRLVTITARSTEYCDYEALVRFNDNPDEYHRIAMDKDFFEDIGNKVMDILYNTHVTGNLGYVIASEPYSSLDYLDVLLTSPKFEYVNKSLLLANHDGHVSIPLNGDLHLHYNVSCDRNKENIPTGNWRYSLQTYNHVEQRKDGVKSIHYELDSNISTLSVKQPLSSEDVESMMREAILSESYMMRKVPHEMVNDFKFEQLRSAATYARYRFPKEADVSETAVYKNRQGDWIVKAYLRDGRKTADHILTFKDKQALFSFKTATKEQIAAKHCNDDIKSLLHDNAQNQTSKRGISL